MEIHVAEKITIKSPVPAIRNYCRNKLILDNPDFYKKERMGKWTGNTPKTINLYERIGEDLVLPFGCLQDIWQIYPQKDAWSIQICPIRPFDYQSRINLYPYQYNAVMAALGRKNGILVMPCGSGKTQSGLDIVASVGGRALWLTHTQDLLNQSKKRAECVFDNVGAGTITAGKVEIGEGITFATVQTLCKVDLTAYRDTWDVIIVDECQHCAGSPTRVSQFYKVMSNLSARYKIGLTATPKRADGLEQSMFALLGGIIHEVSREEVAHNTCPIRVTQIPTYWQPADEDIQGFDGTIDYMKVIENMTQDNARFEQIAGYVGGLKGSAIVLANRVEYLQRMAALVGTDTENLYGESNNDAKRVICLSGMRQTKKAKEERRQALEMLNDGNLDVIFATYQLAKEGLDVPNLRYVVLATPEKDETTVIQSVGRVGRKANGKQYGEVLDFVDNFGMYQGWAKKRRGYYKKIGAKII